MPEPTNADLLAAITQIRDELHATRVATMKRIDRLQEQTTVMLSDTQANWTTAETAIQGLRNMHAEISGLHGRVSSEHNYARKLAGRLDDVENRLDHLSP